MATQRDISAIRFGYGYRQGHPVPEGPAALLASLGHAPVVPPLLAPLASAPRIKRFHVLNAERARQTTVPARQKVGQRLHGDLVSSYEEDVHKRLIVAVSSSHGFFERLVSFWANHFTVSANRMQAAALVGPFEVEAIRPHVMGRFRDMLSAVARHPGMLVYLDQNSSVGPKSKLGRARPGLGLNENLAREIMELHTLGVDGGYSQADVTEFAKILTGFAIDPKTNFSFQYMADRAEPGKKTLLGKVYGGGKGSEAQVQRALDDLAAHPSTARFIAGKLARHFVSDNPPPAMVRALEESFLSTGGDLPALYKVLVERPEAWRHFGEKVKTPFDFLVSGLRALGVPAQMMMPRVGNPDKDKMMNRIVLRARPNPLTVGALKQLNQPVKKAPGPDGWPDEAASWIHPQGLSARLDWSIEAARRFPQDNPLEFLDRALGGVGGRHIRLIVEGAESREEAVALILASPEFNRR